MKWIDKRRKKSLDCKYIFSSLSRLRETMIRRRTGSTAYLVIGIYNPFTRPLPLDSYATLCSIRTGLPFSFWTACATCLEGDLLRRVVHRLISCHTVSYLVGVQGTTYWQCLLMPCGWSKLGGISGQRWSRAPVHTCCPLASKNSSVFRF